MAGPGNQYYPISQEWKDRLGKFGLQPVGLCEASPDPQELPRYRQWIEEGRHGEMAYLERHQNLKFNPPELMPGAHSLVFFALDYYQDYLPVPGETSSGRVARYAWGRDYHKTLGNRLKQLCRTLEQEYPGEAFRGFTDSGPLAERWYAQKAGAGFIGKHTLLIQPQRGSWFFLGEMVTSLPPEFWGGSERPQAGTPLQSACPSGCFRCGKICPTGALEAPGLMDARKCISYLTIEHKGSIPEALRSRMGNWVFGCDLCLEVCPFNLRTGMTGEKDFLEWKLGPRLSLLELLQMDEQAFSEKFSGTPAHRTGRRSLVRNACVAAGNSGDQGLLAPLEVLAAGEDELLAEHASWAVKKLRGVL